MCVSHIQHNSRVLFIKCCELGTHRLIDSTNIILKEETPQFHDDQISRTFRIVTYLIVCSGIIISIIFDTS